MRAGDLPINSITNPEHTQDKYENRTFADYQRLAGNPSLSPFEKVGFPKAYREGKEELIFRDMTQKLGNLRKERKLVMDIGPGCSGPARMMIELCRKQAHTLILADSPEMLALLPEASFQVRAPGCFPRDSGWVLEKYNGKVDAIVAYSLLHVVYEDGNPFEFLDRAVELLAPGGEMLVGDIPNISKRRRFFASSSGIRFHQKFTGTNEVPHVGFNQPANGQIDDALIVSILLRYRNAGFDAYWLPQADDLPMANRREDILIRKP